MLLLIRTAYKGRKKLGLCKLFTLVSACVCLGTVLYISNLAVAWKMYGFGELSGPLAAVYEYNHTLLQITVGEFLALNIIIKILSYIWIMLLLSFICTVISNTMLAFSAIMGMSVISCVMYYNIPVLSLFAAFKYLNPFGLLKTEKLFEGYKALNFFEYPANYGFCVFGIIAVGYVLFTLWTLHFFTRNTISSKRRSFVLLGQIRRLYVGLRRKSEKHCCLFRHEIHRIFVCNKAVLIIAATVFFQIYNNRPYNVHYIDLASYCESQYLTILQGPVTEEKLKFIESEKERVKAAGDEFGRAQRKALESIDERIDYINQNNGAFFIYEEPHLGLTKTSYNYSDLKLTVLCMALLILGMPGVFTPDLQSGMYRIIRVTREGRRGLLRIRYLIGAGFSVLAAIAVYIPYFLQVVLSYKIDGEVFSYPVNSIMHLNEFGAGMSVGAYYVCVFLLRLVAAVLLTLLIFKLSYIIKSQVYTMLAGFILFAVPVILAIYQREFIYAVYPYSMFAGNLFMQDAIAAVAGAVLWAIMFAAVFLVLRLRKERT